MYNQEQSSSSSVGGYISIAWSLVSDVATFFVMDGARGKRAPKGMLPMPPLPLPLSLPGPLPLLPLLLSFGRERGRGNRKARDKKNCATTAVRGYSINDSVSVSPAFSISLMTTHLIVALISNTDTKSRRGTPAHTGQVCMECHTFQCGCGAFLLLGTRAHVSTHNFGVFAASSICYLRVAVHSGTRWDLEGGSAKIYCVYYTRGEHLN